MIINITKEDFYRRLFNNASIALEALALIEKYIGFQPPQLRVGSRINLCSCNYGAQCTVNFIEPQGHVWATIDGNTTPIRFNPRELTPL